MAGEVVDVRMARADDGSFKGFGHVEFATEEAVQKVILLLLSCIFSYSQHILCSTLWVLCHCYILLLYSIWKF